MNRSGGGSGGPAVGAFCTTIFAADRPIHQTIHFISSALARCGREAAYDFPSPELPPPIPGTWYVHGVYPRNYDFLEHDLIKLELHGVGIFCILLDNPIRKKTVERKNAPG